MAVTITPSADASTRTKNRLREHGEVFVIEHGPASPICMAFARSILVTSLADDWFGWLPCHEIEVS